MYKGTNLKTFTDTLTQFKKIFTKKALKILITVPIETYQSHCKFCQKQAKPSWLSKFLLIIHNKTLMHYTLIKYYTCRIIYMGKATCISNEKCESLILSTMSQDNIMFLNKKICYLLTCKPFTNLM